MAAIQPIQFENAGDATNQLMAIAEAGLPSNMIKTIAHSPRALEGYLELRRALAGGTIDPKQRELIALAVAQANLCEYSLAYHTALGRKLGLTDDHLMASREGRASDRKVDASLRFARELVVENGDCSLAELRQAGYTDKEIVEIVAIVSLNVFENYFNMVARTDLDHPKVRVRLKVA
jgi:AhpD family alkylhydroperoxidase